MNACLGIDTSCYTTSVALCSAATGAADGPFFQQRQLLSVEQGARGLRQSEALFQHVSRLPQLLETLCRARPQLRIVAVCASVRPRPQDESYMPVFRAGAGMARGIAAAMGVPCYETSHQEGHLRAARVGADMPQGSPYLAMHLSGGTTELLAVRDGQITLLGGTRDLHAGQLIDRVGVALGLAFPAGPALESLAARGRAQGRLTAALQGMDCHFSGAEAQAMRWIEGGDVPREDIAAELFDCVARTVSRMLLKGLEAAPCEAALLGGGVASASLLREEIRARVAKRNRGVTVHFARPELAGDNAVGTGLIGIERWERETQGRA